MIEQLRQITGLDVYEASLCEADGVTYFLGRRGQDKLLGSVGEGVVSGSVAGQIDGRRVVLGMTDHDNARSIRLALPWAQPRCIGLATSIGLGDRLGLATPGHIRAVRRKGQGLKAVLAQQSIREMTRTRRTPDEVMDAATWGVLQEGFRDGFGSDADHLQDPTDIDATVAAGFTLFTIDPGRHVVNEADQMDGAALADHYAALDFETLQATPDELRRRYVGREFPLKPGGKVALDEASLLRAAVKYGGAVAHTVKMYRHLAAAAKGEFELEVSVDETESPTSPAEHYFFAAELKRLGVQWVSLAPRFIGRFEKGVDYIGDTAAFTRSFARHAAVMQTLGPYKISIHSGSDKFSIYPIVAQMTEGYVHLKTAGTSYLEALRAIAGVAPGLYREILDFARANYETDKATYHVSADVSKVPAAESLADEALAALLDDFHARQVLHVTFGSVLTAEAGERFRTRLYAALKADEEAHYAALARHLGLHAEPFARGREDDG